MPSRMTTRRRDAIDRFHAVVAFQTAAIVNQTERDNFTTCCSRLFADTHMTTQSIEQVTEIIRIILRAT